MIATAGPSVRARCPECRRVIDLPRAHLGRELSCPDCLTWFHVERERRRRWQRPARATQLLPCPPTTPYAVPRAVGRRGFWLTVLAIALLALALAFGSLAPEVPDVVRHLRDSPAGAE